MERPRHQQQTRASEARGGDDGADGAVSRGFQPGNFTALRNARGPTTPRKAPVSTACTNRGIFHPDYVSASSCPARGPGEGPKKEKPREARARRAREPVSPRRPWAVASGKKREKWEPSFGPNAKEEPYPYLSPQVKEAEAETKDQKAKGFLCGRGRGLNDEGKFSRQQLPALVASLRARIAGDWQDAVTRVHATDQELVEVSFFLPSLDSEQGVHTYMNLLSRDSEGMPGMRKVSQLWGVRRDFSQASGKALSCKKDLASSENENENSWLFFLFAPAWVRMRATDAYYTAHPRGGSLFRMSVAGSSILYSLSQD